MPTFSIENFGCRATEADAVILRHSMLSDGWTHVAEHHSAEVVILNTCTVTAAADSQARDAVRKIHRANPGARIFVTGCYAQRAPEEIAALEGVSWVVGNSRQNEIPAIARNLATADPPRHQRPASHDFVPLVRLQYGAYSIPEVGILHGDIFAETSVQPGAAESLVGDATRPILKIQDGCNHRCAYCVIPSVRGRSRSLPPDDVIAAVRQYFASGVREVVLSGINLGSYGRDLAPRVSLGDLVPRILRETPIEQLRFSSIEPQHITEDFIALIASSGRIAPHFHVPLQSGADRLLHAMRRWYRGDHYAERINLIRRMLPHSAIGADVIVGFPGETEEDFQTTLDFIRAMPFSYLHVFSFSARPGTEAASLPGALPAPLIRERARALRALGERKAEAFRSSQIGQSVRALTLARCGDLWTEALTANYLKVRIAGRHGPNEWHSVRVSQDAAEILLPCPR